MQKNPKRKVFSLGLKRINKFEYIMHKRKILLCIFCGNFDCEDQCAYFYSLCLN